MEPSSAARKPRTTVVFAIAAVALLVAGFGIGYLLGRPAATTPPGAVSGLTRPDTIPRVDGWYRNASVSYLDYGPQSNVAVPILAFFQAASPSTPVAGQRNIIDTIPGRRTVLDVLRGGAGYSELWRVVNVVVDAPYTADSLKDARSILAARDAGQVNLATTDTYVNCPVVS